jgi:hypothetical protein
LAHFANQDAHMPSNVITVIHKFIRRELFDLAERLFRAEPQDCSAIRQALDDVAGLLHQHAAMEKARLHPLLTQADPTLADRLLADHHRLDDDLEGLRHAARQLSASSPDCAEALLRLHLDWTRFVSRYLAHLDDEERTLFVPIANQLPSIAQWATSMREQPEGKAILLRLWSVTTCAERASLGALD